MNLLIYQGDCTLKIVLAKTEYQPFSPIFILWYANKYKFTVKLA